MDLYEKAMKEADPRTDDWPLVKSPAPVIALLVAYVAITLKGPKLMENHKPLPLKLILIPYNFFLVGLSVYMFKELAITSYLSGYQCQMLDYSNDPLQLRMANAIWWFFFSKAIELLDTVFFILRKKNQQITFLHVYHHCTMLSMWWVGVKYVAGGEAYFPAMINSFVHIFMYAYYGLSVFGESVRPFLWWKRYLTQLQLTQFVGIILHVIYGLFHDCTFPTWMMFFGIFYCSTLTILFLNYYFKTYTKRKEQAKVELRNKPVEKLE
ncbi:hypothetical protein CHUAL_007695 [Chamberlinius hualienensis]